MSTDHKKEHLLPEGRALKTRHFDGGRRSAMAAGACARKRLTLILIGKTLV
ncbi:MAG: hypothetical protein HQ583_09035 [Candidatus Abyssubacteria bacterium]|nr:hypothetical protein [Candidatus Abyssubacteria bacterium]